MRNLRLDIAYDGTDFFGWQRQPDKPSIQGAIETAIGRLTGETVSVAGAGRTDSGVHAAGQVANFHTQSPIPCGNLVSALNRILPAQIRILSAAEERAEFQARYSAVAKHYRYRILQARICPPYLTRFVYHCPFSLDLASMAAAASALEGVHDFTSFAASDPKAVGGAELRPSRNLRRVFRSRVMRSSRGRLITYDICGSGFLYHMVRNIAGTLIEIGRGALPPDRMDGILAARHRSAAGPTAPASGLTLVKVFYEQTRLGTWIPARYNDAPAGE